MRGQTANMLRNLFPPLPNSNLLSSSGVAATAMTVNVKVAYATHESPLPPRGGEGGVSRSTAPRRRSRPAMQRGPWKGLGHDFVKTLRKHIARVVSLLCWHASAWTPPLPQPLPREGGGEPSVPPNTFIHTPRTSASSARVPECARRRRHKGRADPAA